MKKVVKIIIFLFICVILLQLLTLIFKKQHNVIYNLKIDNKNYTINETYKNNKYYYKILVNNEEFAFVIDNIYHKDKKIINDIKYYEKDNLKCIFPMLNNASIACTENNKLYSYYYVKDRITEFANSIEKLGYKLNKVDDKTTKVGLSTTYINNIPDNINIYIWKYNGFYSINEKAKQVNIFANDTYNNDLGILVDKYYVIPNYDDKYEYNSIYIYNITNNKSKILKLKKTISKNSYINGILDNKLYLFDVDNLIQYEINPRKNKISEVGNKEIGGLYYSSKFEVKNIYEFKDKLIFGDNKSKYKYENKIDDLYFYLDESNNLYLYSSITNTETLLLNEEMTNITIIDNIVYYVNDNTLYLYDINGIVKPLVIYDELRFNPFNRVAIYKK